MELLEIQGGWCRTRGDDSRRPGARWARIKLLGGVRALLGEGEDGITSHLHDGGLLAQRDLTHAVLHVFGQVTHEVVDAEGFGDLLQFLIGEGGLLIGV